MLHKSRILASSMMTLTLLFGGAAHSETALEKLRSAQENQARSKYACPEEDAGKAFLKFTLDDEVQLKQAIYGLLKKQNIIEKNDCSCPNRWPDPVALAPVIDELAAQVLYEDNGKQAIELRDRRSYFDRLSGSYTMQIVAICK